MEGLVVDRNLVSLFFVMGVKVEYIVIFFIFYFVVDVFVFYIL